MLFVVFIDFIVSIGICIWAENDRYVTPGATYDETCAGHRINTELVKITTE